MSDMSEVSKALPNAWIDRLFLRFQAIYGNKAAIMWGDVPFAQVQAVWADTLSRYEAVDIKRALETMVVAYVDYPPTLPQFMGMCRDARAARGQESAKITHVRYGQVSAEVLAEIHKVSHLDATRHRDPKDWARKILAKDAAGDRQHLYALQCAKEALGVA